MKPTFKPMLAAPAEEKDFRFPLLASFKLDGLRGVVLPSDAGKPVLRSRSMKPFTNVATSEFFSHPALVGFDGELIVGEPSAKDVFIRSTSELRNSKGDPKATFWVFDHFDHTHGFESRHAELELRVGRLPAQFKGRVQVLPHARCESLGDLLITEQTALNAGFEGLITRSLNGPYKQGRSTINEGYMLKLKRFSDSEGMLLGIVEQLQNNNEAYTNELGRTARSSHQENKSAKGIMGALVLRDLKSGIVFSCGTGFDNEQRVQWWSRRVNKVISIEVTDAMGKRKQMKAYAPWRDDIIVKYKYFAAGMKYAPRFPVYLGERDPKDMEAA